ncbi:MAG: hypothetical protein AAF283_11020 [Cyanobacteria bacterium P01_A01_bin.70]
MKILLTGFEPNDDGLNASEIVVRSLKDDPPTLLREYRHDIHCKIMPGDTHALGQVVDETLAQVAPDIYLGLGQARGYNRIALEQMAKNLRYFVTPDRAGNTPKGESIVPDAPLAYLSSLPAQSDLVSRLEQHLIPARIANDCGTHLCNQVFYQVLHWRALHRPDMRVGFVHIPILPEQVIQQWPNSPFMPLEMTQTAITLILDDQITQYRSTTALG